MQTSFATVSELIEAKGGPAKVADAIGKKPGAVRMMKLRKRLPREVWPELVEAYEDVTLDTLKRLEAQGE